MTIGELIDDLKRYPQDEEVVVIIDDGVEEEDLKDLEEGSILEITEAGGYNRGMRLIRVKPR